MGIFNFGGSKASSSSQSQSSSFDNTDSFGFDFGQSGSVSGGQSTSKQNIAFEDLFANLFGGAAGAAAGVDTSKITEAANFLFSGGTSFLEGLGGDAGSEFLTERLGGIDEIANQQVEQLGADLERFLGENVSRGITAGGIQAGTLGGGRGEVQKGIAERGAAEEFIKGSTAIRANSRAEQDAIAQFLSGQAGVNAGIGLEALPGLLGLAEGGAFAGLTPFAMLSQIMGGPTVLTDAQSTQFGESFGTDFGAQSSTGRAGSQSTSSSSSKEAGFNFGFGGK